jgi:hypothetical protein
VKPAPLLIAMIFLLQACGKTHNAPSAPSEPADLGKPYVLPTASQASPSYDNSSYGIYKGVTINAQDSAATFALHISNDGKLVYGLEYMNAVLRDSLIRYVVDSATMYIRQPLQPDSSVVPAGRRLYTIFQSYNPFKANATIQFGVEADGSAPVTTVSLNANQTLNAVMKERSDKQVYCYEGSYTGSAAVPSAGVDSGRIAFVATSDSLIVIQASITSPQFFPAARAAITNNQFNIVATDGLGNVNFIFTGSISGNSCMGTWVRGNYPNSTGTFTAHRTL